MWASKASKRGAGRRYLRLVFDVVQKGRLNSAQKALQRSESCAETDTCPTCPDVEGHDVDKKTPPKWSSHCRRSARRVDDMLGEMLGEMFTLSARESQRYDS